MYWPYSGIRQKKSGISQNVSNLIYIPTGHVPQRRLQYYRQPQLIIPNPGIRQKKRRLSQTDSNLV
jgi:hypothetical protein